MGFNKKFFTTGGIVASTPSAAAFDPLQNFETVTYTGNGSTQKITGYIRKGGAFNGSSSVITIPNIKSQLQSGASFTISCWVNVSSSQSGEAMIINTAASSGTQGVNIGIRDSTGLVYFQIRGNNNLNASGTTNLVGAGWKNIVLTHTTSSTILYVNGTQEASIGANTIGTIPNDLTFGKWANSSLYYLNGSIDQVRIFNTALNSTQVGQLALEDYTDPKKSTTDYFGDGSGVALYELDEDANTTPYYPYGTGAIDSGQSAVFNGSSSRINIPDGGIGASGTARETFSISLWVNVASASTAAIINDYNTNYSFGIELQSTGVLKVINSYTGGVLESTGTTNIADNNWHHLLLVNNTSDSTQKLYLDGNTTPEVNQTLGTGTKSASEIQIGHYLISGSPSFVLNGKIDQVRIYSSALSASDVEALVSETNVPTANLVAYYKLDGNANDETTNYNGTWGGTEAYSDPAEFPNVAYNGTPTNVNFLGMAFQPDLVWVKSRDSIYSGNHQWYDSVRGAGKVIYSDGAYVEATNPIDGYLGSFDSNGFSLSSGTRNTNDVSNSGENYVAWCWKAGGAAVSNTNGTITSTVSANPDAGFSIVKFTGSLTSGQTVGHGLTEPPSFVILKDLDSVANWYIYHQGTGTTSGYINYLRFDSTTGTYSDKIFYPINFNSTTFTPGNDETVLQGNIIAYCFHSVVGYQKVGSYLGTNAPNNVVTTGFRPRWIMIKSTGATNGDWNIFDTVRENEPLGDALKANTSSTEGTEAAFVVDITDTGFELDGASGAGGTGQINSSGITYIYLAIA
jgi:hypothetical protein